MSKMYSENKLKVFLASVCDEFTVLQYSSAGEEHFVAKIQCKLRDSESRLDQCKHFIRRFSSFTSINWIVTSRRAAIHRMEFSKLYGCQYSSRNKTLSDDKRRRRNLNCQAKIDFKFKKMNKCSMRKCPLLKLGLNVVITVNFDHSHEINIDSVYRRCDDDVKQMFMEYFDQGMTPPVAKHYHEMLLESQGNPTMRQIRYFLEVWRKLNQGAFERDTLTVLKQRLSALSEKGVQLYIKENPLIIVVITPIMKRLFENGHSDEIAYIDSSGSCDQMSTKVTFVFVSLKIGAFPIACVLHTAESEANYTLSYMAVRGALECGTEKKLSPSAIIITDDSDAERNALKCVFPESVFSSSAFHTCESVWSWLWLPEHKVNQSDRITIMKLFQKILYSNDKETAAELFSELLSSVPVIGNPALSTYITALWNKREDFCLSYSHMATNNYTDVSLRIFKDVFLQRSKVFNSCALVSFVAEKFERYHKRRLLEFTASCHSKEMAYITFFKNSDSIQEFFQLNENEYKVQSEDYLYTVLTDLACCECPEGSSGKYCKHLCYLEKKLNVVFQTTPLITTADKMEFVKIALGNEEADDFYLDSLRPVANKISTVPEATIIQANRTREIEEQLEIKVNQLRQQFSRVADIFATDISYLNTIVVKRFVNMLSKIETPTQARSFAMERLRFSRTRSARQGNTATRKKIKKEFKK